MIVKFCSIVAGDNMKQMISQVLSFKTHKIKPWSINSVKSLHVLTWNKRFHKIYKKNFKILIYLNHVLFQPDDSGHGRPPGERSRPGQELKLTECNEHKCGKAKRRKWRKKHIKNRLNLLLLLLLTWKRFSFHFFGVGFSVKITLFNFLIVVWLLVFFCKMSRFDMAMTISKINKVFDC